MYICRGSSDSASLSSSLSLHRFPQTIHNPSFPLFMWVRISWLLFTVFPSWFMTKEKHCIQVTIQSIISMEMLSTVGEHRDLLYHMMENKQKKGASRLQQKSTILVIWTAGCKEKKYPFSYYSSPWMGFDILKKSQETKYIQCANTQLP